MRRFAIVLTTAALLVAGCRNDRRGGSSDAATTIATSPPTTQAVETTMLASLPGGMCHCPHWGVLTKGRLTVRYADRVEVIEAGDAFYMPPGHAPAATAGSEFIMFSPADLLAETEAAIAQAMRSGAH